MHAIGFGLFPIPVECFSFIFIQGRLVKPSTVTLSDIGAFRRHDQLGPGLSGAGQQGLKLRARGV